MTGFDSSTIDTSTLAGLLLLANFCCLALVGINLLEDRRPYYRAGCAECRSERRRREDADRARRERETKIRAEEQSARRRRETDDDDRFRWR